MHLSRFMPPVTPQGVKAGQAHMPKLWLLQNSPTVDSAKILL